MLNSILKLRKDFVREHIFEIQYLSNEEYEKLDPETRKEVQSSPDGSIKYFKTIPEDIPDEDLQQYLSIKMFNLIEETNQNIRTIKSILVFWLVMTIVGIALIMLAGRVL